MSSHDIPEQRTPAEFLATALDSLDASHNQHRTATGTKCPTWCASDHDVTSTCLSHTVATVRVPGTEGVTTAKLFRFGEGSEQRVRIGGESWTVEAVEEHARKLLSLVAAATAREVTA